MRIYNKAIKEQREYKKPNEIVNEMAQETYMASEHISHLEEVIKSNERVTLMKTIEHTRHISLIISYKSYEKLYFCEFNIVDLSFPQKQEKPKFTISDLSSLYDIGFDRNFIITNTVEKIKRQDLKSILVGKGFS